MTPFFRQFMDIAHRQYADAFVLNRHRDARWRVRPTDWQRVADDIRPYSVPADISGNYLFGLPVELDDGVVEGPILEMTAPPLKEVAP